MANERVRSFRWLGVSVLSLFELFEYFYKKLQAIWSKRKTKTKTSTDVQIFETKPRAINSRNSTARFVTYPTVRNNSDATIKNKARY